jgi:hypothetical protein
MGGFLPRGNGGRPTNEWSNARHLPLDWRGMNQTSRREHEVERRGMSAPEASRPVM